MSNKAYDILKRIQRFLPSLSVFMATVLALYHVPAETVAVVVGTIDAVAVLLGAVLEVSTARYNAETEAIATQPGVWDDSYLDKEDKEND